MNSLKKYLPEPVERLYRTFFGNLHPVDEELLIHNQKDRYPEILNRVRQKKEVTVLFLVLNPDIWKYENVYRFLEKDPRFRPIVVVCPAINLQDNEAVEKLLDDTYQSFLEKGYNVIHSYDKESSEYIDLNEEFDPDVIFFTNPYGYTFGKYQIRNFPDALTCYAQYSFIMEEVEHFYNKLFHSLLWKAFYETELHKKLAEKYARNGGENVEVTGYPGTDSFLYGKRVGANSWKKTGRNLKRVIWAPHWSVIPRGSQRPSSSNFLELSQFMIELADRYRGKVQFAFKPHPYLKRTLYDLKGWGKRKTEEYYAAWDKLDNGQLETGNYTDLFNGSDAMIHDSMSFIAEYLFCGKPSLFLKSDPEVNRRFNEFGNRALDHHYHGDEKEDIIQFLENVVLNGEDPLKEKRNRFYRDILVRKNGKTASENIYDILCREIFEE